MTDDADPKDPVEAAPKPTATEGTRDAEAAPTAPEGASEAPAEPGAARAHDEAASSTPEASAKPDAAGEEPAGQASNGARATDVADTAPSLPPVATGEGPSSAGADAAAGTSTEASSTEASSTEQASGAQASDAQASGEQAAEGGDPTKKKKRRRRRRKKKKADGESAEAAPGEENKKDDAKKKESQLPFQAYFEAGARRHAFSVGEVVAGRVVKSEDDVAVIDLFGKATAYSRQCEPRDVPIADLLDDDESASSPGTVAAEADGDAAAGSEKANEAASSTAAASSSEAASSEAASPEAASPEAASPEAASPEAASPEAASSEAASSEAASPEAAPSGASIAEAATEAGATPEKASAEPPSQPTGASTETGPSEMVAAEEAATGPSTEGSTGASVAEAAGQAATTVEGMPEERTKDAQQPQAAKKKAQPELPPPVEPSYRIRPEGVEPLETGAIARGRVSAVAESGHIALVNERIDRKETRRWLNKARKERERVQGLIFGFNRGGFDILIYGVRAFCPVSGISIENVQDPTTLLGQWAEFHVQSAKSGTQGLVVSRRSILEKEARKKARALIKSLEGGEVLEGTVKQVREFGLFVDIGGVEGLVHQSELSWEHGTRPADVAKPGDVIQVKVLKVHERESKRERHDRISLSVKALQPDPWDAHGDALREGRALKGTVVRTAEFGAFVQVAPGIDGLLHVSELGKDLPHAKEAVNDGDEIAVVIERVDKKSRRISLSKLSEHEAELFEKGELDTAKRAPKLKPGSSLKVVVTQVQPAGLHVSVEGVVGKRGRGFIPNSEMGTPRGTDHRKKWPPGTEIDVTVIGTDRDGGLRCSRKRYLQDEERRAVREYRKEVSKQGLGTFGDILRQKLEGLDSESSQ